MAGRQQELGGPASKFSPRKFSEKIALLNKKEAEGNAEFEEIIKEVQATTKRGTCNVPPQPPPPQASIAAVSQSISPEQSQNLVLAAAAADDELEEVYQNLMSCQYDDDKDIADSSSEVSSSARDQIEDIERSIREDTVAPVVVEHHCAQALIYTPKVVTQLQRDDKFSGTNTQTPVYAPEQPPQGYYRERGTSVGSTTYQPPPESVVCYGWQVSQPCNDYLRPSSPERLQWQKSSSDPALNSASHKLSPAPLPHPNQSAGIHGSCSENYIQAAPATGPTCNNAAPGLACYSMLEQRQDLPGIKICAIEDLEATSQGLNHELGPPVLVHADSKLPTVAEKGNSALPDIAKLQFSGSAPEPAPAERQHPDVANQWPAPVPIRPSQMDFGDQLQSNWVMRAQVSPVSDLGQGDDLFETKPVNSLLSSSECGLQHNHLNQCSSTTTTTSNSSSAASRRHHHQLASSIHQQRLRATSQDQIIRSHSHNNISYVTKQRRQNCAQSGTGGGRCHQHPHQHHHYHLQHHQAHYQHQHQHQQHSQPATHYEHHMGQFGLQVGCPRHLEEAKSRSNSSVRPQYGSISPINSPASQPTSPQSENQNSPAADPLACPDSYLPYSCSVAAHLPLSAAAPPSQANHASQQAPYAAPGLLQASFPLGQQYHVSSGGLCQQQQPMGGQLYRSSVGQLEEPK